MPSLVDSGRSSPTSYSDFLPAASDRERDRERQQPASLASLPLSATSSPCDDGNRQGMVRRSKSSSSTAKDIKVTVQEGVNNDKQESTVNTNHSGTAIATKVGDDRERPSGASNKGSEDGHEREASRGKKVTPCDDEAKSAQQKKIQQLSLAAFFLPGGGTTSSAKPSNSRRSLTTKSSHKASSSLSISSTMNKKRKHSGTVNRTGSPVGVGPASTSSKKSSSFKQLDTSAETSPIRPRRTDDMTTNQDAVVKFLVKGGQDEEKSRTDLHPTTKNAEGDDDQASTGGKFKAPKETIVGLAAVFEASEEAAMFTSVASCDAKMLESEIDAAIKEAVEETMTNGIARICSSNKKSKSSISMSSESKNPMDAFLQPVSSSLSSSTSKPKTNKKTSSSSSAKENKNQEPSSNISKKRSKSSALDNGNDINSGSSKKNLTTHAQEKASPLPVNSLSDEKKSLYEKYTTMRDKHIHRVTEIVENNRDGLDEEKYDRASLETALLLGKGDGDGNTDDFPTVVTTNMCIMIEGSKLPLSILVQHVSSELMKVHGKEWSVESIEEKVKLLAQRKAYFEEWPQNSSTVVDIFEDITSDRLWRWEVTTLDILPPDTIGHVRKARSALKKVSNHHSALLKLIKSTNDILDKIVDPRLPELDNFIAKISLNEERVLKYEREAEKQRLAEEAKARKAQEQEAKKRAKEAAEEESRRKREEAAEALKEAKRKKEEEKEQKEAEKKLDQDRKQKRLDMQKSNFMSFFNAPKKSKAETNEALGHEKAPSSSSSMVIDVDFDCKKFRAQINNSSAEEVCHSVKNSFWSLKRKRRKPRTVKVPVTILTTVQAEDEEGWDVPAYSEKRTIKVRNKYIFLSFHEDCRPPYHGTWNKQSSIVSGRAPFRKDKSFFDYDYDSEAEWEEGDDEVGEDVEDEGKDSEEEADDPVARMYDYDDGFCVADDQFLENEEDADDDVKAMYKKKLQKDVHRSDIDVNQIQIIAPEIGGIPLSDDNVAKPCVEGFEAQDVISVLASYEAQTLCGLNLYLDAFPQLDNEVDPAPDAEMAAGTTPQTPSSNKDENVAEYISAFARFAHHNKLNSKEKLVEELRTSNPIMFDNKAKALRKLDAIAVKKKHPNLIGVNYWEVNRDVLLEYSLTDVLDRKLEDVPDESLVSENAAGKAEIKRKASDKSSNVDYEAPVKKKSKKSTKKTPASGADPTELDAERQLKGKKLSLRPSKQQSLMMAFLKKGSTSDPSVSKDVAKAFSSESS